MFPFKSLNVDFMEAELGTGANDNTEPGKSSSVPFIPKEEEMDEEEFDKMMEERYKSGSAFVSYAEDDYENKRSIDRSSCMPSDKDPIVWKVKCAVCFRVWRVIVLVIDRLRISLSLLFYAKRFGCRLDARGFYHSVLCISMLT